MLSIFSLVFIPYNMLFPHCGHIKLNIQIKKGLCLKILEISFRYDSWPKRSALWANFSVGYWVSMLILWQQHGHHANYCTKNHHPLDFFGQSIDISLRIMYTKFHRNWPTYCCEVMVKNHVHIKWSWAPNLVVYGYLIKYQNFSLKSKLRFFFKYEAHCLFVEMYTKWRILKVDNNWNHLRGDVVSFMGE